MKTEQTVEVTEATIVTIATPEAKTETITGVMLEGTTEETTVVTGEATLEPTPATRTAATMGTSMRTTSPPPSVRSVAAVAAAGSAAGVTAPLPAPPRAGIEDLATIGSTGKSTTSGGTTIVAAAAGAGAAALHRTTTAALARTVRTADVGNDPALPVRVRMVTAEEATLATAALKVGRTSTGAAITTAHAGATIPMLAVVHTTGGRVWIRTTTAAVGGGIAEVVVAGDGVAAAASADREAVAPAGATVAHPVAAAPPAGLGRGAEAGVVAVLGVRTIEGATLVVVPVAVAPAGAGARRVVGMTDAGAGLPVAAVPVAVAGVGVAAPMKERGAGVLSLMRSVRTSARKMILTKTRKAPKTRKAAMGETKGAARAEAGPGQGAATRMAVAMRIEVVTVTVQATKSATPAAAVAAKTEAAAASASGEGGTGTTVTAAAVVTLKMMMGLVRSNLPMIRGIRIQRLTRRRRRTHRPSRRIRELCSFPSLSCGRTSGIFGGTSATRLHAE